MGTTLRRRSASHESTYHLLVDTWVFPIYTNLLEQTTSVSGEMLITVAKALLEEHLAHNEVHEVPLLMCCVMDVGLLDGSLERANC